MLLNNCFKLHDSLKLPHSHSKPGDKEWDLWNLLTYLEWYVQSVMECRYPKTTQVMKAGWLANLDTVKHFLKQCFWPMLLFDYLTLFTTSYAKIFSYSTYFVKNLGFTWRTWKNSIYLKTKANIFTWKKLHGSTDFEYRLVLHETKEKKGHET